MIAIVQRVKRAKVWPKNTPDQIASINQGLFILIGVSHADEKKDVDRMAAKICKLRILADENDKMNLDIKTSGGEILLVSQFTLLADTSSGNRPSFINAALPGHALNLFNELSKIINGQEITCKTGFFGEYMEIDCLLDGPTTIIIDTKQI